MFRVAITTLGCKVNRADGEALMGSLAGLATQVDFQSEADLYIINSCTVTRTADRQSRQLINRARRTNPAASVVLSGCMAAVEDPALLAKLGVDRVFPLAGHPALVAHAAALAAEQGQDQGRDQGQDQGQDQSPVQGRVAKNRPVLKIQDGCDCACTYCIVPRARGAGVSLAPSEVEAGLNRLTAQGHNEVVLTGIHLGCYGKDLTPPLTLEALLRGPLSQGEGPGPRLRLSSIEPLEISPGLLDLMLRPGQGVDLCPHLHVPIQSGDDRILRAMARPYTLAQAEELLLSVRQASAHMALGTDLMAGFPGEDQRAFQGSLRLVMESPLTHLHVFPYSPRPGTPAAEMPGQVSKALAKERARSLRQAGTMKLAAFMESQLGQVRQVVVEGATQDGRLTGMTDNYLRVRFKGPANLKGSLVNVRLESLEGGALKGRLDGA